MKFMCISVEVVTTLPARRQKSKPEKYPAVRGFLQLSFFFSSDAIVYLRRVVYFQIMLRVIKFLRAILYALQLNETRGK